MQSIWLFSAEKMTEKFFQPTVRAGTCQNLPGLDLCGANRGPSQGVKLLLHGVRLTSPFQLQTDLSSLCRMFMCTEDRLVNVVKARFVFNWHLDGLV